MACVEIHNLSKCYPGNVQALRDCSLAIRDREFVVLVGPSGCGKTTLLRLVAGLENPSSGKIFIDGSLMNGVPPKSRDIAMVFQNYALYPHMTVYKNMAFGLVLRNYGRQEIDRRVREVADILDVADLLNRRPGALSGGQRQRVALGRAIIRNPKVFLFDEPLSNLDAKLRAQMRTEITRLHSRLETTMIYVTHDQTEAMTMGDRMVVMLDGVIQQDSAPLEIYRHPINTFVAGFIGAPTMNFIEGRVSAKEGSLLYRSDSLDYEEEICCADNILPMSHQGLKVILGMRPENIVVSHTADDITKEWMHGTVDIVETLGAECILHVIVEQKTLAVKTNSDHLYKPGDTCHLLFDMGKAHLFDAQSQKRIN